MVSVNKIKHYSLISNSSSKKFAFPILSITNSTYLISTEMFLQTEGSNSMSLMVPSHTRSKLSPNRCPSAFSTGDPEFPPLVWFVAMKQTGTVPSVSQRPKSRAA